MDSLLFITSDSEIFYERHWHFTDDNISTKPLLDYILKGSQPPAVISANKNAYISLSINDFYFCSLVSKEISPFYVLETLNNLKEVLESYFGKLYHKHLKDQITHVYLVVDEFFVNGFPVLNWPSLVQQVVKPKSLFDKISKNFGIQKERFQNSELSEPIIWRDPSLISDQNDIFLDFFETLNMIINEKNDIIFAEITGCLYSSVSYTGIPKMTCTFSREISMLSNSSFHPCVNSGRFNADRILEFVPPDGLTELMTYTYEVSDNRLPFDFDYNIQRETDFLLNMKIISRLGLHHLLHDVNIIVHLPEDTRDCLILGTQNEKCFFSSFKKTLNWNVGSFINEQQRWLDIKIEIDPLCYDISALIIEISFSMKHHSLSNIKICDMDISQKNKKEYRGVKYTSKSGKIEIRA